MKYLALAFTASLLVGAAGTTQPRHLTYSYAEYPTANLSQPVTNFTGPDTGTLDVTIAGRAPDGGLVVQARDWRWNDVRPRQTARCEVYGNGDLACEQFPPLSPAQLALLPLLGEHFYPGRASHWKSERWVRHDTYLCGRYSTTSDIDYTVTGVRPNGDVNIEGSGSFSVPCIHEPTIHERVSMTYDPNSSLPTLVHDEKTGTSDSVLSGHSVDLKLVRNSYNS